MELGNKIVIVGVSASGKSTFARQLSAKKYLPAIFMDEIMWNPGWQYIGDSETVRKLEKVSVSDSWIIEGYVTKEARAFIFDRADKIIYLDYAPWVSAFRYIKRWWKHRKEPRPELQGSPEKFDFNFLKLVWTKGEAVPLNKYLAEVIDQTKIIKLVSPKETKRFLKQL